MTASRPTRRTAANAGGESSQRILPQFDLWAPSYTHGMRFLPENPTVFVRDCQPFCDARFSSREVMRFFGITLGWPPADQTAGMAAHHFNVIWDGPCWS
jgi:hypothetical protein